MLFRYKYFAHFFGLMGEKLLILLIFLDDPYFDVGKNKEIREEETGIELPTHSEISRLLAEHGSLVLIAFLIVLLTPLLVYVHDRTQIFALAFMVFWLLTINHAAMRIAAPAFVYALALLKVRFNEKEQLVVNRK